MGREQDGFIDVVAEGLWERGLIAGAARSLLALPLIPGVDFLRLLGLRLLGLAIRCPNCAEKADGMVAPGLRSTYRDLYPDFRVERIVCPSCGLAKTVEPGTSYELYYRTNFRGHTLWARNEAHIDALIAWLSSGRSATGTEFEALPQWMVSDRAKVVERLRRLRRGRA